MHLLEASGRVAEEADRASGLGSLQDRASSVHTGGGGNWSSLSPPPHTVNSRLGTGPPGSRGFPFGGG